MTGMTAIMSRMTWRTETVTKMTNWKMTEKLTESSEIAERIAIMTGTTRMNEKLIEMTEIVVGKLKYSEKIVIMTALTEMFKRITEMIDIRHNNRMTGMITNKTENNRLNWLKF